MTDDNNGFSGSHLLFAMLAGALAGAAVAMLVTPKSGPETRAHVGDAIANGRERARQLPGAVKTAGVAAREAFVGAMREGAAT